jgi:hypothetical protein
MESMTRSDRRTRRSVRGSAATLAVSVAVGGSLLLSGGAASAAPGGEGAFVIKGEGCSGILPNGTFLFTTDTQIVVTPSGNTKLTCHFDGPSVSETVNQKDFLCFAQGQSTFNSHFVYTKSGQGTLTCQIKPS